MLKARMTLAATALAILSLTGCATQAQVDDQNVASLPPPKDSREAVHRLLQTTAGYCKMMAEKHGADFATCFKQWTDYAIAEIEAQEAARGEPTK